MSDDCRKVPEQIRREDDAAGPACKAVYCLATLGIAPHRRGSGAIESSLDMLDENIKKLEAAAEAMRNALTSLVADCWIEE